MLHSLSPATQLVIQQAKHNTNTSSLSIVLNQLAVCGRGTMLVGVDGRGLLQWSLLVVVYLLMCLVVLRIVVL